MGPSPLHLFLVFMYGVTDVMTFMQRQCAQVIKI